MKPAHPTTSPLIGTLGLLSFLGMTSGAWAQDHDAPVENSRFNTHVYQVKYSRADELASVLLSLIQGMPVPSSSRRSTNRTRSSSTRAVRPPAASTRGVGGVNQIVPLLRTNSLFIQANPEDYKAILDVLGKIDVKSRQVFLEAAVVQVGLHSSLDETLRLLAREGEARGNSAQTDPASAKEISRFLQEGDFPALVAYFKEHGDARVVASPFLLANENEENHLEISETRYVQNTTVQSNQTTLSSQQGESAGVSLSILPTITDAQKTVLLQVDLTVSEFLEKTATSATLPPKAEASLTSSVAVPDGQIIAIGGLTRTGRANIEAVDKEDLYIFLRAGVRAAVRTGN